MAVHQGKPKFVDDAVQLALEYETFQNGRKQRIYQKHFGVRIQQMSQNMSSNVVDDFQSSGIRQISQNNWDTQSGKP